MKIVINRHTEPTQESLDAERVEILTEQHEHRAHRIIYRVTGGENTDVQKELSTNRAALLTKLSERLQPPTKSGGK